MTYPQSTEYHSAIQNPELCFNDPELSSGKVRTTPLGLPYALSGGFALTYTIESGAKKFAVRCFHREVPDIQSRYEMISKRLKVLNSKFFVDFDYEDKGIRINKGKYPLVKMRWVEGPTLGDYISKSATNKQLMVSLRDQFRELDDFLARSNVAHGDIQDLNVIVSNNQLVLIDYDGMYVDGLTVGSGNEIGHKDFQHPLRTTKEFGPRMDRFSMILIDLTLSIIIERPELLSKYKSGGEALLFKANDFKDPYKSQLFAELMTIPSLASSVSNFRAICQAPVDDIPTLGDFLADRSIPSISATSGAKFTSTVAVAGYISSYDVLEAADYNAVASTVGQKVELIGQVVDVKHGVGKRGRGRGKPYVFINFGNWQHDCVKLTIWADALDNFVNVPTNNLVGKWVSVIGLIDPPYEGSFYGKSYKNVGITIERESQIEAITAREAQYRLANPIAKRSNSSKAPSNRELLKSLQVGSGAQNTGRSRQTKSKSKTNRAQAYTSPNQAVLASLKQPVTATTQQPNYSRQMNSNTVPNSQGKGSKEWIFWLIALGLFLLFIFSR